jgi:ABC-type phosphate/phosphonate transport system substrate-binding protein
MLAEDRVQLGIFQGIELAWAQQQFPQLRPLMLVINQQSYLHACLVVPAEDGPAHFADLKGKTLAVPAWARLHCQLYLDHRCRELGQEPARFFAKISRRGNTEDVLDDLVDGKVQAALVERVCLDCYQRRKPGRIARVKVLEESPPFPGSVVAYHAGALDQATLHQFREGLLRAGDMPRGRQLLTLWKLTGFVSVPDDYEKMLADIAKVYPIPDNFARPTQVRVSKRALSP